jgi:hypothetical protein
MVMRFLNVDECAEWCEPLKVVLDDRRRPTRQLPQPHRLRCEFPASFSQLLPFSRAIESALQPRETCLLWVTDWGIFPSNENQHLYYRVRQSYGDFRLLQEAPGHLCLDFERPETVTLIHLCILFGWDVHLIPTVGYARAFVSHDEWIELSFDAAAQFDETRKAFEGAKLQCSVVNQ